MSPAGGGVRFMPDGGGFGVENFLKPTEVLLLSHIGDAPFINISLVIIPILKLVALFIKLQK